jgi:hypothetical protein
MSVLRLENGIALLDGCLNCSDTLLATIIPEEPLFETQRRREHRAA